MPLFTFICQDCGAETEILVRGESAPECPKCGSTRLEKQMSRFAALSATSTDPACGPCSVGATAPCCCQGGQCPL